MKEHGTRGLSPEDVAEEMLHALETGDAGKFARLHGYGVIEVGDVLYMLEDAEEGFIAGLRGRASENERLDGLVDMFFDKKLEEAAEKGDVPGFVALFEKSGYGVEELEEMLEDSEAELVFVNRLRPHFPGGELDEWLSGMVGELLTGLAAIGDAKSFIEAFEEYAVFSELNGPEEVASLLEDAGGSFLNEVRNHPVLKEILEKYADD